MSEWRLYTGITGLLGQYLLCDALRKRELVAVLVRDRRGASAYDRVNRIISQWETRLGTVLTRPVILEGDLRSDGLGLSPSSSHWFRESVGSIVHSAASVRFQESPNGEPMNSNFGGTRRLLELCAASHVREFHYVSTAYSCGRTNCADFVYEELHSRNAAFRNIYEQSKCFAEHLVTEAEGAFSRTIYRPSIIVGEWETGFSPSFNAIYTPLHLVWMMQAELKSRLPTADELLNQLGLDGTESRNIVPVDWVSHAVNSIVRNPSLHGGIYHLTNPTPTHGTELLAAITKAMQANSTDVLSEDSFSSVVSRMDRTGFEQHMEVYRSYFTSDPKFDNSRFAAAAVCDPCPAEGTVSLQRAFDFAIRARFKDVTNEVELPLADEPARSFAGLVGAANSTQSPQVSKLTQPDVEFRDRFAGQQAVRPSGAAIPNAADVPTVFRLTLSGPGGGCWRIVRDSEVFICEVPTSQNDMETQIYGTAAAFRQWVAKEFSLEDGIRAGAFIVTGHLQSLTRLTQLFEPLRAMFLSRSATLTEPLAVRRQLVSREILTVGTAE